MPTVSHLYYSHVLEIISGMGLNKAVIAKDLAIDLSVNPSPKTRYSKDRFNSLLVYASKELKNPHIGLHIGHRFRVSTYSGLGNTMAFCKDLEEAAFINHRFACLVHTLGTPRLQKSVNNKSESTAKFVWVPAYEPIQNEQFRHISEYVLTNYVMSINWLAWGFGRGVRKVKFMHNMQEPDDVYTQVLGCDTEFGADEYAVILEDGILNKPLPTANAHQLSLLRARQERILASFNEQNNLSLRTEQAIREIILDQKPTLAAVAEDIGMSPRSLKRHLSKQETSFKLILEKTKKQICSNLMADGIGLTEIAQRLWYSDQSAFTRAYKSWHGVSPKKHLLMNSD